MSITRMKVVGKRGMGNITITMKGGKLNTVRATGKMADLIARGMASDLGIKKVDDIDALDEALEEERKTRHDS